MLERVLVGIDGLVLWGDGCLGAGVCWLAGKGGIRHGCRWIESAGGLRLPHQAAADW